ncbi:MAG: hypothetical protein LBH86_02015 [Oscillospiraceae bacterium]|jgi:hypothetical protein|nr:hypothetical protein [Oscillospiraceae bacterium]
MKKIIGLALALTLALSLTACLGRGRVLPALNALNGEGEGEAAAQANAGSGAQPAQAGSVSGKDMEQAIAQALSAIGGPSRITLCGGGSIKFEPANEWVGMWGDSWEISDPDMSHADLLESIDSQLTTAGFTKGGGLLGWQWTVHAGVQNIGLILGNEEGDTITLYMTHFPNCYSAAYIAEQEAVMPKMIPAAWAMEVLPENFLIKWETKGGWLYTLARKDGSWLYASDGSQSDSDWASDYATYYAAVLQPDGSYQNYEYTDENMTPRERDWFTSSNETVDDALLNILDYEYESGMSDSGNLSMWVQMCKDYADGTSSAQMRFSITGSMVVLRTEEIAGVVCDVVGNEGGGMFGTEQEWAYDPTTGLLFRYSKDDDYDSETPLDDFFKVVEYTDSPATLGNYPG